MNNIFLVLDPTAIKIGNFEIKWYAILIAFGAILGYFLFKKEAQKMKISEDNILDMIFWTVILGLLGARLYYVIFNWEYYSQNIDQILNIRGGGMAIYGGVIFGIITLYFLTKKRNIPFISTLDAAAPGLLLAQSIGRWGNFMNQEAHGGITSRNFLESIKLPQWVIEQMYINGEYYHPTFFYESLWSLLGVISILIVRKFNKRLRQGDIMAFYLIWYGTGRAVIEGMRTDSLYIGAFRVSQILSALMVIFGLVWIIIRHTHLKEDVPLYKDNLTK